jgi:hypothetical protein
MALFIATEMIWRVKSKQPGPFQRILADQLRLHNVSQTLINFDSFIRFHLYFVLIR